MKKLVFWLLIVLIIALPALGLVSCENTPDEPIEPDVPVDPGTSDPAVTDPEKELAKLESERKYEVVDGTKLHPTYGNVPAGLAEAVNKYMTQADGIQIEGDVTTFQYGGEYRESIQLPTDAIMIYAWNVDGAKTVMNSWKGYGNLYSLNMMTIMNRAGNDWLSRDKDFADAIQIDKGGNKKVHSSSASNTVYYLVPTEDFIEYVWEIVTTAMEIAPLESIVFEEPDMFAETGYSKAFKQEWENYYGEPWQDQTSSPEAMIKSMRLKVYLIDRLMTEISDRMRIEYPDTKIYLASHSTNSYNSIGIASGLNHYINSGIYDGLIGQTWTDTVGVGLMQNGTEIRYGYMMGALEYASYAQTVGDGMFFALADPVGDGITKGKVESDYYDRYYATIVSQLMQPEINRFEVMPWPNRCFEQGSQDYRMVQLNVIAAVTEASGKAATVSAGTPGITYLISDSHSWQYDPTGKWALNSESGLLGVTLPLLTDGIPLKVGSMEMIDEPSDLADIELLLLSFDCQKPLSSEVCEAIAEWILNGGTCLYVGGHDRFEESEYEWWAEYGSPLQALLDMMEADITVTMPEIDSNVDIVWAQDETVMGSLAKKYNTYTAAFEGEGQAIMTLGTSKKAEIVGLDREIGEGRIVLVGLPSAMYAEMQGGTELMRKLVAYACQYTDYEYSPASLLWMKRGNIVAAHSIGKENYIGGRFVNLFDSELAVTSGYTLAAGESALLYDVTDLDLSVPRLGFSGGTVTSVEETADQTVYKVLSPTGIYVASTLLCRDGLYPQKITVTNYKGNLEVPYAYAWKGAEDALLIQARGDAMDNIVITVEWGSTPIKDCEPTFPTFSEFEPLDPDYQVTYAGWENKTYLLNKETPKSADEFVVVDTSSANHEIKYCDKQKEIIYKFDLNKYPHLVAVMFLEQNYLLQVSTDGENWKTIQNFELVNGFRDYGAHKATVAVASDKYAKDCDYMYVRLANSDVTQGHGGSISKLIIYYNEAGLPSEGEDTPSEPWKFDEPNYQPTDVTAAEWAARYAEYASLKIQTNATTESHWRPFIVSAPGDSDAGWRHATRCIYTDTKREIVFGFNLSVYPEAVVVMHVDQNYILEVSPSGTDWLIVQDYSAFHTERAEYKEGEAYIAISSELLPKGTDIMYIRLRNTDTTKGNGGALLDMTIYHKGTATTPATPPAEEQPVQGDHVAADITAEEWSAAYADCKRLTVVTNADTESEWRPFAHAMPADSDQGWKNARCLFTDLKRELVFRFDLNTYRNAAVVLHVNQNYI
ncbi:MAG: hypothetical protein IIX15_01315, partial [Clostridia bacterium]|nr:hypothetical protein [Clostridia bacterium]